MQFGKTEKEFELYLASRNPKNWQALADSAKLARGVYSRLVIYSNEQDYEFMYSTASMVHLGARAVSLTKGANHQFFAGENIIGKIAEVSKVGSLIYRFAVVAMDITVIDMESGTRGQDSARHIEEPEKLSAEFKNTISDIENEIRHMDRSLRPDANIVLTVLEEENGILPAFLKPAITSVLNQLGMA